MFRIYYNTKVRNFNKVLYNPTVLHKIYNYIYCRDIDLETIQVGQTFNIGNLQQQVLEKDNEGFFIAPGLYMPNPLSKADFAIDLFGNQHNMSFNAFSSYNSMLVGSLIYPSFYAHISVGDEARAVDIHDNIVYMKNLEITSLENVESVYLNDTMTTVAKFNKNLELCDWLNKTSNLSIYSLTTALKNLDMNVYFRCYGGSPKSNFVDNPMPQYKLEITDLDTEETETKYIHQFHSESISAKHRYKLMIKDELNNIPVLVNDSSTDGNIYVDFSNMDNFTMMSQKTTPSRKTLAEIAEPLFQRRVK
jgi:hypothetical protein